MTVFQLYEFTSGEYGAVKEHATILPSDTDEGKKYEYLSLLVHSVYYQKFKTIFSQYHKWRKGIGNTRKEH